MHVFDGSTKTFKLGESYSQFKPEDVVLILGLRCDGNTIEYKRRKERCALEE